MTTEAKTDNTLKNNKESQKTTFSAQESCAPIVIAIEANPEQSLQTELAQQIQHDFAKHKRDMASWQSFQKKWPEDVTIKPLEPILPKLPRRLTELETVDDVRKEISAIYRDFHYKRLSGDDYSRRIYALRTLANIMAAQQRLDASTMPTIAAIKSAARTLIDQDLQNTAK